MDSNSSTSGFLLAGDRAESTALDVKSSPELMASDDIDILKHSTVFGASINVSPNTGSPSKKTAATLPQTTCPICDQLLPQPVDSLTVEIGTLKPRFLRELKKMHPLKQLPPSHRVCTKDLAILMQNRIETLLEQDQKELSRLQNDAMKNLGEYEQQEQHWQKQFEQGWTFGEKCADNVARFGGSWKFIGVLVAFLCFWAFTNVLLGQPWSTATPWDPYPFILLNLFLSMIAALQAPVIMMSQNRQSQIDRIQGDFVSTIILRSEHQVRHVNAKLDHLLSEQWRRLLEIQQTQTDLLQMLQYRHSTHIHHEDAAKVMSNTGFQATSQTDIDASLFTDPRSTPGNPFGVIRGESFSSIPGTMSLLPGSAMSRPAETHWSVETHPDDHVRMLLAVYFGLDHSHSPSLEDLLFAHWHTDGDNFLGIVNGVKVEVRQASSVVRRVVYDLTFNDPSASLDDVLAGEGTVELRNDMDVKCMEQVGRYLRIEIHHKGQAPTVYGNGDLPPRYKSTFVNKREDKITDFWKARLTKINFTYSPPHQVAVLTLAEGQFCERMRVDFFPENNVNHAKVYMRRFEPSTLKNLEGSGQGVDESVSYLKEVVGPRPLSSKWLPVAHALWPENAVPGSNLVPDAHGPASGGGAVAGTGGYGSGDDVIVSGGGEGGEMLMESGLVTVEFKEKLVGPGVYVFLCDETRVAFRGVIV
ncbi:DUF1003-domain-containing protein [Rhizoclosmatium globosum]|uniref:DUF1003-domain-containing protein n=1 Tax=Rhizoclosmatium globosum TaxID=329046 RepID=A0A1Y2B6P2_9FUNG|nr:DUF1003-domain-containing protein [Rhizoclosmatium globosum]|eukprot:ORY30509.1 DUF1003-domain-containing protein [Rhizoclosmatium globosum]